MSTHSCSDTSDVHYRDRVSMKLPALPSAATYREENNSLHDNHIPKQRQRQEFARFANFLSSPTVIVRRRSIVHPYTYSACTLTSGMPPRPGGGRPQLSPRGRGGRRFHSRRGGVFLPLVPGSHPGKRENVGTQRSSLSLQ